MSHGLQPVIHEQLGEHEEESKGVDAVDDALQSPLVPTAEEINNILMASPYNSSNYQHHLHIL